ncbi:hypothetical protein CRENPOLYSF2_2430002 [Crenothrix polyspora]|uniref:Uncharacterized protein n=1 Tax=Crenothrix polyspora TaxID=360316 RepID=A0A1R4H7T9_9GAMM|nr:hypothetical protein CRENPOLYSF2_2430002 [Crenothrix polyspora]
MMAWLNKKVVWELLIVNLHCFSAYKILPLILNDNLRLVTVGSQIFRRKACSPSLDNHVF